jgi:hypothetical protein
MVASIPPEDVQRRSFYSIPSAIMERPRNFTSIEMGGRRLLPCTISPRAQVLPPSGPTFNGSYTVQSHGFTTIGWLALYLYCEARRPRSVMYSNSQWPKGPWRENPQSPPPGSRITMAGIFSWVRGFTKMNFFAAQGLESSSADAATVGPSLAGAMEFGSGGAGTACSGVPALG